MNIWEPTEEEREAWAAWVAERPSAVRAVAERFFPWKLYLLKSSKHRVTLFSFEEPEGDAPVTLKVRVGGDYNAVAFERHVFGVLPEDLEECDLPGPDEVTGSLDLDPEAVREMMSPPTIGGLITGCMS